jgi:hypothetical protein
MTVASLAGAVHQKSSSLKQQQQQQQQQQQLLLPWPPHALSAHHTMSSHQPHVHLRNHLHA